MPQLINNIYKYPYLILLKGSFFLYDSVLMAPVNDNIQLSVSVVYRCKRMVILFNELFYKYYCYVVFKLLDF
jgi:hypothetical protein